MFYTRHGHWTGDDPPSALPAPPVTLCGGPARCPDCALDAHRHHQGTTLSEHVEIDWSTTTHTANPGFVPVTTGDTRRAPTVGRIVHYVSYGTPGGEHKSECRAAIVTAADEYQRADDSQFVGHVDLCVLNPTGLFFNRGVHQHDGDTGSVAGTGITTRSYPGGTWHWPERA